MKYKLFFNILTVIFIVTNVAVRSQDNKGERFSVEWMKSYTTEEDFGKEDGIFSNIVELILGESENRLITPFNLVTLENGKFFVLDHGHFKPLIGDDSGIKYLETDSIKIFPSLVGLCKYKSGVLFTDSKLNKIFFYSISDDAITEFKTNAVLNQPTGITVNNDQTRIFVSETKKHRIAVFDNEGRLIQYFGKRGDSENDFNYPTALCVDEKDKLLVLDVMNFKLKIFQPNFELYKSFGAAGDATGYFSRPKALALDSFNHIFIVDALFHAVQVFDEDGKFLYSFGGQGRNNGRMWLPSGIFIDSENRIYVADSYNSRIQEFRLVHGEN